jgi:hypothetical protein
MFHGGGSHQAGWVECVVFAVCLALSVLCSREEEAIKLDGLNVAQMKELRDKSEKHVFQAEVDRMMKLIINSLYKNKEVRHGTERYWTGLNVTGLD